MKTKTLLIAAVMFLGISVAAFAQLPIATYTVGYVPQPTAISFGHTERGGDVTFTTVTTSGPTITGTISLQFTSPVTFAGTVNYYPPDSPTGVGPTLGGPYVEPGSGNKVVTITITPDPFNPERFYGLKISGIRFFVDGEGMPISADIVTTGNALEVGENHVDILLDTLPAIENFRNSQTATYNTLGELVSGGTTTMAVDEVFRTAFDFANADDWTLGQPTINAVGVPESVALDDRTQVIKISFDKTIPTGVTITFPQYDSSTNWELATDNSGVAPLGSTLALTHSSAVQAAYYRIRRTTDQLNKETFSIGNVTVAMVADEFPIYTPVTLYAKASIGPLGSELTGGYDYNSKHVPHYSDNFLDAATPVLVIESAYLHTVLMVPYATTEVGYATGLAIANTTTDPGLAGMGGEIATAIPQDGKIVFHCYNNDGTYTKIDTSDSDIRDFLENELAWFPLTDEGLLGTGLSYAVDLSQLLRAAGVDANFHGYIIIVCDFTNAHGQYFLTNYSTFTNGAQMLVLALPRTQVPEDVNH